MRRSGLQDGTITSDTHLVKSSSGNLGVLRQLRANIVEQQQAERLDHVYRNASGVHAYSPYNDFVIRGFRSSSWPSTRSRPRSPCTRPRA